MYDVPDATLMPPKDRDLKLRFDVNAGPEPGELNMSFDTVARYLNQHAFPGCHLFRPACICGGAVREVGCRPRGRRGVLQSGRVVACVSA